MWLFVVYARCSKSPNVEGAVRKAGNRVPQMSQVRDPRAPVLAESWLHQIHLCISAGGFGTPAHA